MQTHRKRSDWDNIIIKCVKRGFISAIRYGRYVRERRGKAEAENKGIYIMINIHGCPSAMIIDKLQSIRLYNEDKSPTSWSLDNVHSVLQLHLRRASSGSLK